VFDAGEFRAILGDNFPERLVGSSQKKHAALAFGRQLPAQRAEEFVAIHAMNPLARQQSRSGGKTHAVAENVRARGDGSPELGVAFRQHDRVRIQERERMVLAFLQSVADCSRNFRRGFVQNPVAQYLDPLQRCSGHVVHCRARVVLAYHARANRRQARGVAATLRMRNAS
jgi:hypothetical protein